MERAVSHMVFGIRGKTLDPDAVTKLFGIEPDWKATRGEPFRSPGQKRGEAVLSSAGIWAFSTESRVDAECWEPHALFLLDTLEPVASSIRTYAESGDSDVGITIWCEVDDSVVSEGLPGDVVERLGRLCNWVGFSIILVPEDD